MGNFKKRGKPGQQGSGGGRKGFQWDKQNGGKGPAKRKAEEEEVEDNEEDSAEEEVEEEENTKTEIPLDCQLIAISNNKVFIDN